MSGLNWRDTRRKRASETPARARLSAESSTHSESSVMTQISARDPFLPGPQGLYDPSKEHDSCGVGFVADMHNRRSHDIVKMGLQILVNLDHRGAVGADPKLGDGCGILTQIPHRFFAEECAKIGISLPGAGDYGVG